MKRSHSRRSYPFDKPVPVSVSQMGTPGYRKAVRRMHNRKQRQHNQKLCREGY